MRIHPKACSCSLSLCFKPGKLSVARCILTKPPGKARTNQFVIYVSTVREQDLSHSPPVAVLVPGSNRDHLGEDEF